MKMYILFLLLFFALVLNAQETWEYRYHHDFSSSQIRSIVATDSCIYTTGVIIDGVPPYLDGSFFIKYSLEGELLYKKTIVDSFRRVETWRNTLHLSNEIFYTCASFFDTLARGSVVLKLDTEGNILQETVVRHYDYPEETFIKPTDFKIISDTSMVLLSSVSILSGTNTRSGGQINILDTLGNILSETIISHPSFSLTSISIEADEEFIYISGALNNLNVANENYFYRTFIIKLNHDGEILQEMYRPSSILTNWANYLSKTNDGGFVYTSGIGIESDPFSELRWHNTVVKVNEDLEVEWETLLRAGKHGVLNYLEKIIELEDGSGYVTAGLNFESEHHIDWLGCLAKVAPNGDSLWMRLFSYVPLTTLGEDGYHNWHHAFYDMDVAPDGGFIMGGESRLNYIPDTSYYPPPIQQIYLVKTDEYGCLVPDCHLVSTDEAPLGKTIRLKIHPNPTSEELYVYAGDLIGLEQAKVRIFNLKGQLVQEFDTPTSHTTYITRVGHMSSGVYLVNLMDKGRVVDSQRLVVE